MPARPHLFTITTDDGATLHCAGFESEAALRQALNGHASPEPTLPAPAAEPAPRPPGRPSFDGTLEEACAALAPTLVHCPTTGARVTRVLQYLAARLAAHELPSGYTVAQFLRHHAPRMLE